MVNGPPCPQCGHALRWLAPQNAWGCDRCQQMFAPQQVQPAAFQPQQPPPQHAAPPHGAPHAQHAPYGHGASPSYGAPHAAMPPPAGGPPKKSKAGLVIGLVVGALVLAGGIIALVLVMRGKSSAAGGTRDEVIKATFAALAAGDVEALVDLADVENATAKTFECTGTAEKDERFDPRDPKKLREQYERFATHLAARTKGVKIEVLEVLTKEPPALAADAAKGDKAAAKGTDGDGGGGGDGDGDGVELDDELELLTVKAGAQLAKNCKARTAFRSQTVKLRVKLTEGDAAPFEYETRVQLTNLGGGWYLGTPPNLPVGFDKAVAQLEPMREALCNCTDRACAETAERDIERSFGAIGSIGAYEDDDDTIPTAKLEPLQKLREQLVACRDKAKAGESLVALTALKTKMCACKDRACADQVSKELDAFGDTMKGAPDEAAMAQLQPVLDELLGCMSKAATGGLALTSVSPATGPAEGGNEVTLAGTGFQSATPMSVLFGTQRGTIVRTTSDTEMQVLVPKAAGEAVVDIVVNMSDGKELRLARGYTYPEPGDPLPPEEPLGATPAGDKFARAKNLPAECETYRQSLVRADRCASYPAAAKTGLEQTWAQMLKMDADWRKYGSSLDTSYKELCTSTTKTMNDMLRQMGC